MCDRAGNLSSSRLIIILMVSVVICFVLSSSFAQFREAAIEARVNDLVGNAIPSIQYLARARTSLRDVLNDLYKMRDKGSPNSTPLQNDALSKIKDMEASFSTYWTLPFFPSERKIAQGVPDEETRFEQSVKDLFKGLARQPSLNQRVSLFDRIQEQAHLLDDAFNRIIEFDASQSQRLGLEISSIRMQSLFLIIVLDILSIALAAFAAFIAIRAVQSAIRGLKERADELDIFAGRVAHDLKNPIHSILLATSLSDQINAPEKKLELSQRIRATAERMNITIEGLLDFAQSGAKPSSETCSKLGAALDSIAVAIKPDADSLGIRFQIEPFRQSLVLPCSTGALMSVLSNLIRNALKYVQDGTSSERWVRVRVIELSNRTRIEIEDNGPGLEPGKEEVVFRTLRSGQYQALWGWVRISHSQTHCRGLWR